MALLFSNFPPVKTELDSYTEIFHKLIKSSDELSIASGYISADSAVDLRNIIEQNHGPKLTLCIGMHFFEGLTNSQKVALESLNDYLTLNNLGGVFVSVTFPFHGKLASFKSKGSIIGSIVGSSNLSNIVFGQRLYEADYLIENHSEAIRLETFIGELLEKACEPIGEVDIPLVVSTNPLLNDQYGVTKVTSSEVSALINQLSSDKIEIPLKANDAPKSNLNAFFGEGRRNQQGFVMPRPWYEVELIVPKEITSLPYYPKADSGGEGGVFQVVTDDGWEFDCKVSGDYSKNLRSDGDLKILGKWIKGRLEVNGALEPGTPVTDEVLSKYGRNTISLSRIEGSNKWFMNFGVEAS